MYVDHLFFVHSSVDEPLGRFHVWAIVLSCISALLWCWLVGAIILSSGLKSACPLFQMERVEHLRGMSPKGQLQLLPLLDPRISGRTSPLLICVPSFSPGSSWTHHLIGHVGRSQAPPGSTATVSPGWPGMLTRFSHLL